MDQILALIGFSFVSAVTPGPNNILIGASGTTFGFRRTIRHVLGTALGLGTMMIVVVPSAGLWAWAGGVLGRLLEGGRWHRLVSLVLAGMLAATVVTVWL